MRTRRSVVAIRDDRIVGVAEYDYTNDTGMPQRVLEAATEAARQAGVRGPDKPFNREVTIDDVEFMTMLHTDDVLIGMVEIGFGKWGFPHN